MLSFQDQISTATKSQLEAQLALFTALSGRAFESVEKLVDLNINLAKASLEESGQTIQQLMSAKDPQEFLALAGAQAQPGAEKALAYGRHVAGIASSAQAEFAKLAEEQFAETNRQLVTLVDELSKNAPAGSENVVAFMKTAIGNANAGYEQLTKTAKQAVEAFESNVNTATSQFAQATPAKSGRSKK